MALPGKKTKGAEYFGGGRTIEKTLYGSLLKHFFYKNLRTREEFYAHAEAIGPALFAKGTELRDQAISILDAYHQTRLTIYKVEKSNRSSREVLEICEHIRKELKCLVPENFPEIYPMDRLVHIPRYLKAMRVRAERGTYDQDKDRSKMAQVEIFIKALDEMLDELSPHASREKKEAVEAFRWMIEEFQISLFAQELKTQFPISAKRLEKQQGEIERMV